MSAPPVSPRISGSSHRCKRCPSPRPQHGSGATLPFAFPHPMTFLSPTSTAGMLSPERGLIICRCARSNESADVEEFVAALRKGLEAGLVPRLIPEGEGGTYMMFDAAKRVLAIFKPSDEEPPADNNPKKHSESPSRKGIIPGDGALREVAAYQLDRGWAGVPLTTLLEVRHPAFAGGLPKIGSAQKWVHGSESAEEFGPSLFPARDVHRIGILDVRLGNTDRHVGNMLARRGSDGELRLVPIDHGFVLPAQLGEAFFDWLHWPQAQQPFGAEELEHIASIDVEADSKLLRKLGIPAAAVDQMCYATVLLKKAAAAGLTLHSVACLVSRVNDLDEPCELENIIDDASLEDDPAAAFLRLADELVARRKLAKLSVTAGGGGGGSRSAAPGAPFSAPVAVYPSSAALHIGSSPSADRERPAATSPAYVVPSRRRGSSGFSRTPSLEVMLAGV